MIALQDRLIRDRLVYVEWVDARGVTTDWVPIEELTSGTPCICISVGLLLADEPDRVIILPHFGIDPNSGCGEMVIPRSQIRRLWGLRPTRLLVEQLDQDTEATWAGLMPARVRQAD